MFTVNVEFIVSELARGWITLEEAVMLYGRITALPVPSPAVAVLTAVYEGFESNDDAIRALA